jgi:hypothetical protein
MRFGIFLGLLVFLSFGQISYAQFGCCVDDAAKYTQDCTDKFTTANAQNNAAGYSGLNQAPATSANACPGGNAQNNTAGPGAARMNSVPPACQEDLKDCSKKCKPYLSDQKCASAASMALQNCVNSIGGTIASAQAAAATLANGASGAALSASQACGGNNQKPTIPTIPSIPSNSSNPSSPTAQTASTPTTPSAPVGPMPVTDSGGSQTQFASATQKAVTSAIPGASSLNLTGLNQMPPTGAVPPPMGMGGGMGGSSGSSGVPSAAVNKNNDLADKAAALKKMMAEGQASGRAPANEYGTDGGGGMPSLADASAADLSQYLPGGAKDPTKKKDDQKLAGNNPPSAHPDIVAKEGNIFSGVSNRMHLLCDMKELIGCN